MFKEVARMANLEIIMTRKEVLALQKVYRRMKRMGIMPYEKERIILELEKEVQYYRAKIDRMAGGCDE